MALQRSTQGGEDSKNTFIHRKQASSRRGYNDTGSHQLQYAAYPQILFYADTSQEVEKLHFIARVNGRCSETAGTRKGRP